MAHHVQEGDQGLPHITRAKAREVELQADAVQRGHSHHLHSSGSFLPLKRLTQNLPYSTVICKLWKSGTTSC